jgi:WD40 repeat protein/tRNA A-37 threonylcarbamoyl transferase component Bud32
MPEITAHPSAQALSLFSQGKLSEAQAKTVAAHLETCPGCRQAVAALPPDSFLGKVRAAQPGSSSLPPHRPGATASASGQAPRDTTAPADVPPELASHSKFRVLRELGRGGMGVIYLAEHRVLEKPVALKVISPAVLDNPEALARFRAEAKAAARLDHPNIARAHDADQAGDLHFLVLEFVEGQSLAQVLEKRGPLPVAHACSYVRQAALGLQHASEREMVHRDIKPHNLMLTPRGQVKVLDFGLARMRGERQAASRLTRLESFMGTPEYVAPEQAADARQADIRADIYSLGCTLYFLLTGRPPFVEETAVKLVLAHIEKEPAPLHEVRADVPAELSAVVAKMLAKDPAQRYQRPVEVAQALLPFIKAGLKPAAAGGAPAPSGAGAADAGTRIGGDTSKLQGLREAVGGKAPAGESPAKDSAASPFEGLGGEAPPPKKAKPARKEAKPVPRAWYRRWPVLAGAGAAVLALGLGAVLLAAVVIKILTPDGKAYVVLEIDQPGAAVSVDGQQLTVTVPGDDKQFKISVSPGQHRLVISKDGFEARTQEIELKAGGSVTIKVRLEPIKPEWTLPANGEPLTLQGHTDIVRAVAFSPDGKRLASASDDKTVKVWDTPTGEHPRTLKGHDAVVASICFSPDGKTVASGSYDNTIRLWDAQAGKLQRILEGHKNTVTSVCFSPDGKRLASASWDQTIRVWDAQTRRELFKLTQQFGTVNSVCFSPDGRRLASACGDGVVRVWDVQAGQGQIPLPLKGHQSSVLCVCFSPDGRRLASASTDKTVQVWDAQTREQHFSIAQAAPVNSVCFSPDGKLLASASDDRTVRLWDAQTGRERFNPQRNTEWVRSVCFSLDGKLLASASDDKTVKVWAVPVGPPAGQAVGTLTIEVNEPNPDLYVDGEKVTVTWADGGKKAEVRVAPDKKHRLEVKKEGFKDISEEVEVDTGGRKSVLVRLEPLADLPPEKQVEAVAQKLRDLNPGFDGEWAKAPGIEGDKIVSLFIRSDYVRDLTPLQALPHLRTLHVRTDLSSRGALTDLGPLKGLPLEELLLVNQPVADLSPLRGLSRLRQLFLGRTKVADLTPLQGLPLRYLGFDYAAVSDLSPLRGMKELEQLHIAVAPLTDLKPLQGLKLRDLTLHATSVEDLSPLKGMPLRGLNIHRTRVKDLSPLKGMKLEGFVYAETPVEDISVLKDMPLRGVGCNFQRERDEAVLRSLKTLETINGKPAAQFWKEVDGR